MNTQNIPTVFGLGQRGSQLLTTLSGQGKIIFTTAEAQQILGGSRSATYKLLHDLMQGGWLHSLGKGRYLIIPLEAGPQRQYTVHGYLIAQHLAPEGYIAYWTALHHHGLTEQIPGTIWVATPRRHPARTIAGVRYAFVTLRPHKMFGQEQVWLDGQPVPIADLEKSLADALDHPEHCGGIGEVGKALTTAVSERQINLEKLTDYTHRMRNGAIFKRLGYLVEQLSLPVEGFLEHWRAALSAGYAQLDPGRPATGLLNRRWQVQVNVSKAELTGWMET